MTDVHVVVPAGIDDPQRPSGGNHYDRRLCDGLAAAGWRVHEHGVPGPWPTPDGAAMSALARLITELPTGALVLVDGLVASAAPAVLVPAAPRLRLVVLLHMPLDDDREAAVLTVARAVLTTSAWTRERVLSHYELSPHAVHVARPGADPAPAAPGTDAGGHLLCVAALAPHKGHDVLVAALARVDDLDWRCRCVGPMAGAAEALAVHIDAARLRERVALTGPRTGAALDREYAAADVLVLASRTETYGMVVPEALARALPVIATDVGGVPEALGRTADGTRPGLLVPPDNPDALATALRRWLTDPELRRDLRRAAAQRRAGLPTWDATTAAAARVLAEVAA